MQVDRAQVVLDRQTMSLTQIARKHSMSRASVCTIVKQAAVPPGEDGGPNRWECWMKDPDGYVVVIASPDGSADGLWHPGQ
jgi:hypothetical protein